MEYNNSQVLEKQLSELCKIYESKCAETVNLIRESLSKRQNMKAKIVEDKERAISLFQIIERLDESIKIATVQLEAANKMEDPESLKQLQIIKKYESMVREQRAVWAKYEEEYEQLPMAKERRKVQLQILKTSIELKLLNYKIEEKKKMITMKHQINKRKDQIGIINFAKFMVEYEKRKKHYFELRSKINYQKEKEKEYRHQIQELEQLNINRANKINVVEEQPSMNKLSLPLMDLSDYIVPQKSVNNDYNNKNPDTVSMYSLNLEQEYMNSEENEVGNNSFKTSTHPSKMETSYLNNSEESQDTLMDVDTEEFANNVRQENVAPQRDEKRHFNIHNGEKSKKNSQESVKKSGQEASKKRENKNLENCENVRVEQRNGNTERPVPTPPKMPKHARTQEDNSNSKNTHDSSNIHHVNPRTVCSPEIAAKVQDWQRSASPKKQAMDKDLLRQRQQQQQQQIQREQQKLLRELQKQKLQRQQHHEQHQQHQHQSQRQPQQQQQRQPLKEQQPQEQRHTVHQQQQQFSCSPKPRKNSNEQTLKRDSTGLPNSNKPVIISNEQVYYDPQKLLHLQQGLHKKTKQTVAANTKSNTYHDTEALDDPPQMAQQLHTAPNQTTSSMSVQSEQTVPPQYHSISADSMMSANICTDSNMSADNISAIIGSDITEPGGAAGLINHLYGDSDGMSDEVDLDFANMSKFCSPIPPENSNHQQQPIHNENYKNSVKFDEATMNQDPQQQTNRNFGFLQFQQMNQGQSSQRFF